jgi:hypothetical protein
VLESDGKEEFDIIQCVEMSDAAGMWWSWDVVELRCGGAGK